MIIGVLKERDGEARVAITPDIIKKNLNSAFILESGAGQLAGYSDQEYEKAGFQVESNRRTVLEKSNVLACLNCLDAEDIKQIKKGTVIVGNLSPLKNAENIKLMARVGLSSFCLSLLPRITRAQSMDILSSQNNIAGYQSVIFSASRLGRIFPLMVTAAGSVSAVQVLVIGAGVAGLQAIATAKRLGAVVAAYDVRHVAKEQVESLGASFVEVDTKESGEGQGGYAKDMSEAYKIAQEEKLSEVVKKQNVVITTAQIPGCVAPKIITKPILQNMKQGSVVIDLSIASGGNCEISRPDEEVLFEGVRVFAPSNILNESAGTASQLFSANIAAFIKNLLKFSDTSAVVSFDLEDELVKSTLLTGDGVVLNPRLK